MASSLSGLGQTKERRDRIVKNNAQAVTGSRTEATWGRMSAGSWSERRHGLAE